MELKLGRRNYAVAVLVLLIVPYGIETYHIVKLRFLNALLIVPYGIETRERFKHESTRIAFNRTLWN